MDLWIRSQSKRALIKAGKIFTECGEVYATNSEFNERIGGYETKERALEVLDEIQMHIKKQDTDELLVNSAGIITGQKHYGRVYEMPEE